MEQKKKTHKTAKAAGKLVLKIVGMAAIVWIILHYVAGITVCHENNMYPMIKDGDLCISYKLDPYKNGDVVLYEKDNVTRIGRIVATAGHNVEINDEGLIVDNSLQYEKVVYPTTPEGSTVKYPYTVPDGSVFLLNDYREDTSDSRTEGAYRISDLKGSIVLILRRRGI